MREQKLLLMVTDLFPPVPGDWIAAERDGIVVVEKPAGLPCLGGRGEVSGDLVTRLGRSRRADLVCPAPLDPAASGLVALAENRAASRALARAAERAPLTRTWLAVVRGEQVRDGLLEHRVYKSRRGLSAEPVRGERATALTALRVVGRGLGASLVELSVTRGRPSQLRAQLAAAGAPIVGDRERGGPAARRLMLHAAVVSVPDGEGSREHRSDEPAALIRWLAEGMEGPPRNRAQLIALIREAAALRWGLADHVVDGTATTAFRVVDGLGDGIAGLAVDIYGDHLVAHVYPGSLPLSEGEVLDALADLGAAGVYVKRHPIQANELVDTRRDELAPAHAIRGKDAADELVVLEEGVPYLVRLGDGLSTGLFLDQRENRARLRGWAAGRSVLNLFSYACPFTVAAAAAGAARTVSVDAAAPALEAGRANVENAAGKGEHTFIKADAFEVLDDMARRSELFEVVVVDPPTYSTSGDSRWKSGKAWEDLARRALGVAAAHGRVLCCSNDRRLSERRFERHLEAALAADGRQGSVQMFPSPADFPAPPGGEARLKTGVIELR